MLTGSTYLTYIHSIHIDIGIFVEVASHSTKHYPGLAFIAIQTELVQIAMTLLLSQIDIRINVPPSLPHSVSLFMCVSVCTRMMWLWQQPLTSLADEQNDPAKWSSTEKFIINIIWLILCTHSQRAPMIVYAYTHCIYGQYVWPFAEDVRITFLCKHVAVRFVVQYVFFKLYLTDTVTCISAHWLQRWIEKKKKRARITWKSSCLFAIFFLVAVVGFNLCACESTLIIIDSVVIVEWINYANWVNWIIKLPLMYWIILIY